MKPNTTQPIHPLLRALVDRIYLRPPEEIAAYSIVARIDRVLGRVK